MESDGKYYCDCPRYCKSRKAVPYTTFLRHRNLLANAALGNPSNQRPLHRTGGQASEASGHRRTVDRDAGIGGGHNNDEEEQDDGGEQHNGHGYGMQQGGGHDGGGEDDEEQHGGGEQHGNEEQHGGGEQHGGEGQIDLDLDARHIIPCFLHLINLVIVLA